MATDCAGIIYLLGEVELYAGAVDFAISHRQPIRRN